MELESTFPMMTEEKYAIKMLKRLREGGRKGGLARARNLGKKGLSKAGRHAVSAREKKRKASKKS